MPNIQPTFRLDTTGINFNLERPTNQVITNKVLALANTEYSHVLQNKLRQLIIRSRDNARLQIAFVSGESSTKYFTVRGGNALVLGDIDFNGETLYLQANKTNSTVEILELYNI